jgi:hypothetical protein
MTVKEFAGFDQKDFDAFVEKKWSNHRFNLERMRVREKLEFLKKVMDPAYEAAGVPMQSAVTLDHPHILNGNRVDCLWLYFARTPAACKELAGFIERDIPLNERVSDPNPQHNHLMMGLRVFEGGVEVALQLHRHAWLDARNLFEKMADTWEGANLKALLANLSEEYVLQLGDDEPMPVARLAEGRPALFRERLASGADSLRVKRLFARESDTVAAAAFSDAALDALNQLLPLYRFAAWDRENDFISMKKAMKEQRLAPQAAAPQPVSTPIGAPRRAPEAAALKAGDAVRVSAGLLSGKQGKVVEVDGKGRVKVLLGALSVTLALKEVRKA